MSSLSTDSDDFVVEQVASFISEGLAANEHVIAIATTRHWNAITGRLDDSGIAYGRATSAGQLILIEADEALDAVTVDGESQRRTISSDARSVGQARHENSHLR